MDQIKMIDMKQIMMISVEKLLEMQVNRQDFVLIEVLSEEHFNNGHIPGAIHIPLNELNEETLAKNYITKEDTIVVYCTTYSCPASTEAAIKLLEMGYEKTYDFKAGKQGWDAAGFELEVVWDFDDPQIDEILNYTGMFGRKTVAKVVA
jgi:rhodanese-related sulfurtransferase